MHDRGESCSSLQSVSSSPVDHRLPGRQLALLCQDVRLDDVGFVVIAVAISSLYQHSGRQDHDISATFVRRFRMNHYASLCMQLDKGTDASDPYTLIKLN